MSRHRFVRNLDLDAELAADQVDVDEYDVGAGQAIGGDESGAYDGAGYSGEGEYYDEDEYEDDGMTPEERAQMISALPFARDRLKDIKPPISDKAIQDSLWHYWFDVDKTVAWLRKDWEKKGVSPPADLRPTPDTQPRPRRRHRDRPVPIPPVTSMQASLDHSRQPITLSLQPTALVPPTPTPTVTPPLTALQRLSLARRAAASSGTASSSVTSSALSLAPQNESGEPKPLSKLALLAQKRREAAAIKTTTPAVAGMDETVPIPSPALSVSTSSSSNQPTLSGIDSAATQKPLSKLQQKVAAARAAREEALARPPPTLPELPDLSVAATSTGSTDPTSGATQASAIDDISSLFRVAVPTSSLAPPSTFFNILTSNVAIGRDSNEKSKVDELLTIDKALDHMHIAATRRGGDLEHVVQRVRDAFGPGVESPDDIVLRLQNGRAGISGSGGNGASETGDSKVAPIVPTRAIKVDKTKLIEPEVAAAPPLSKGMPKAKEAEVSATKKPEVKVKPVTKGSKARPANVGMPKPTTLSDTTSEGMRAVKSRTESTVKHSATAAKATIKTSPEAKLESVLSSTPKKAKAAVTKNAPGQDKTMASKSVTDAATKPDKAIKLGKPITDSAQSRDSKATKAKSKVAVASASASIGPTGQAAAKSGSIAKASASLPTARSKSLPAKTRTAMAGPATPTSSGSKPSSANSTPRRGPGTPLVSGAQADLAGLHLVDEADEAERAAELEKYNERSIPVLSMKHEELVAKVKHDEEVSGKSNISLVVVGHVDAGKSTLMGRLLYEVGELSEKERIANERGSKRVGKASFAFAWGLDALGDERDRGVTIDIATTHFQTPHRNVTLLDAPGHRDFIPAMISGAAQADVALLVVDGSPGEFEAGFERGGQTREHAWLVRSLGVKEIIVGVNKMDMVDWSQDRYDDIVDALKPFLASAGFTTSKTTFMPLAAMEGINITENNFPTSGSWFTGPTLMAALDKIAVPTRPYESPLRIPVSNVFKGQTPVASGVAVSGRLCSGLVQIGDNVRAVPGDVVASVRTIEVDDDVASYAVAGQNATLYLAGIDSNQLSIGTVLCPTNNPVRLITRFTVQILVFDIVTPIVIGTPIEVFHHSVNVPATISRLLAISEKGQIVKKNPRVLQKGVTASVELTLRASPGSLRTPTIPLETAAENKEMGRVLIRRAGETIAAGMITELLE